MIKLFAVKDSEGYWPFDSCNWFDGKLTHREEEADSTIVWIGKAEKEVFYLLSQDELDKLRYPGNKVCHD